MTQILLRASRDYTTLATDRLVATAAGQSFDKNSNKNILYVCADAIVSLAYTGIAFLGKVPTDQWLVQLITGERFELKPPLVKPTSWASDEGLGQTLKRVRGAFEKAQESVRLNWRKEWMTLSFDVLGTGWHWNKRGRERPIIVWISKREGTNEFEIGYKNRLWHYPEARGKPFTVYSSPANHSKAEMEELRNKLQNKDWQTTELILVEEIRRVAEKVKHVGPDVLTITILPPGVGQAIITDRPQQPRMHKIRSSFVPDLQAEVHLSPWVIGPGVVQPPALLSHSENIQLGKYLVSVSGPNKPGPMFAGSLKRPSM